MIAAMGSLGAPELIIVLIIILLVFGSTKLPKLARSLGQAQKEFKHGLTDAERDEATARSEAVRSDDERPEPTKDSPAS